MASNVTAASKAARRVALRSALSTAGPRARVRTTVTTARPRSQPSEVATQYATKRARFAGDHTAAYVTGSLPVTASARPCFTSRRRWASASETAMLRDP